MFLFCSNVSRWLAAFMTSASPIAIIDGVPILLPQALGVALALLAALTFLTLIALWRAGAARRREREAAEERQEAIEERFAGLAKRSEEHTSELQSRGHLVCRLLLEK